jgi:starvation-inducible DNA-binding protein
MNEEYHSALKAAFASEYAFYLKAQNFHWNVEGSNFPQYHGLFGDIYEEVGDIIDAFAENLRKVGTYVPASFSRFSVLSQVDDEVDVLDAGRMLSELYQDSETMAEIFKAVYKIADQMGDYGLSNFFAERQDAHKKHSWLLRSTLKGNETV